MRSQSKRIVVIGGLDPSGRAGILADVETIYALGATVAAVITTVTAQGGKKFRSEAVTPALVAAQLDAVSASGPVDAVKLGVVPSRAILDVIVRWQRAHEVPIVIDPVVKTSRGERLSQLAPRDFARLSGPRAVLTPNAKEWASARASEFPAVVVKSIRSGCDGVFVAGQAPLLLKGTVLARDPTHHRGTGCRFASVLAVHLALGDTVAHAARAARRYVRKFLSSPILRQVR
jgi:hydroxymethylpyrimidine/phosphomethylpyrimidine kinase